METKRVSFLRMSFRIPFHSIIPILSVFHPGLLNGYTEVKKLGCDIDNGWWEIIIPICEGLYSI